VLSSARVRRGRQRPGLGPAAGPGAGTGAEVDCMGYGSMGSVSARSSARTRFWLEHNIYD
jgi:hypothetical protein